eukprot:TRINITY_DN4360_c0_g2_i3.p1 TRINITY_DN4360_c0_g2~~TRINITY_DN4360_c0_g2_i3.p1  ORF type:complete len:954 (-),score=236.03 TRINITY_DN4360_c0_g2_i3:1-2862(-)
MPELTKVDVKDGEKMQDVCKRIGIPYEQGVGFYLLTKTEKVSDSKQLILWNGKSYIHDTKVVREHLKLEAEGEVNIKLTMIPKGSQLFIQSTSASRKLSGSVLLQGSEENNRENLDPNPQKKKRSKDELIQESPIKEVKSKKQGEKPLKKSKPILEESPTREGPYIPRSYKLNWDALMNPSNLAEQTSVAFTTNDDVVFEHSSISVDAVHLLQQKLMKSIRKNDQWRLMESTDLKESRKGPCYIWRSQRDPKVHLAYLMQEGPLIILEDPSMELCLVINLSRSRSVIHIGSSEFIGHSMGRRQEMPLLDGIPTPDVILMEMAQTLITKWQSDQVQAEQWKNRKPDSAHEVLPIGNRLKSIADVQPIDDQTWKEFLEDGQSYESNQDCDDDSVDPKGLRYSIDVNPQRQPSGSDAWVSYATDFHQVHDDLYCRVTLGIIKEMQLHPEHDDYGIWSRDGVFSFTFFRSTQPKRMFSMHGREIFHMTCNVPLMTSRLLIKISLRDSSQPKKDRDFFIKKKCQELGDGPYPVLFINTDEECDSDGGYNLNDAFEAASTFFGIESFGGIYMAAWRNLMRPLLDDARFFAISTGLRQMSKIYQGIRNDSMELNPRCPRSNIAYIGGRFNGSEDKNDSEDDDDDEEEDGDGEDEEDNEDAEMEDAPENLPETSKIEESANGSTNRSERSPIVNPSPKKEKRASSDVQSKASKKNPIYTPPHYKVIWDGIIQPFDDDTDFDEVQSYVPIETNDDFETYSEIEVPRSVRDSVHGKLMDIIRRDDKWSIMESTFHQKEDELPRMRFIYRSERDPRIHLVYVVAYRNKMIIIEDPSMELSLVTASSWIGTPDFVIFGRMDDEFLLEREFVSPDAVLSMLAHNVWQSTSEILMADEMDISAPIRKDGLTVGDWLQSAIGSIDDQTWKESWSKDSPSSELVAAKKSVLDESKKCKSMRISIKWIDV